MNRSSIALAEEASHAFFRSISFLEFATDPDDAEKKRLVRRELESYGPVNCSLIGDQLMFAPCTMHVKQLLADMALEVSRTQ